MQEKLENQGRLAPRESSRLRTDRPALSGGEWGKLSDVLMSPDFQKKAPFLPVVVSLGTFAGLRTSEIGALRWNDIDSRVKVFAVKR